MLYIQKDKNDKKTKCLDGCLHGYIKVRCNVYKKTKRQKETKTKCLDGFLHGYTKVMIGHLLDHNITHMHEVVYKMRAIDGWEWFMVYGLWFMPLHSYPDNSKQTCFCLKQHLANFSSFLTAFSKSK